MLACGVEAGGFRHRFLSEVLRNVDENWQHVPGLQTGVSAPADIVRSVDLRPELLLPPPVSPKRLEELGLEIDRIADLIARVS